MCVCWLKFSLNWFYIELLIVLNRYLLYWTNVHRPWMYKFERFFFFMSFWQLSRPPSLYSTVNSFRCVFFSLLSKSSSFFTWICLIISVRSASCYCRKQRNISTDCWFNDYMKLLTNIQLACSIGHDFGHWDIWRY